MDLHPLWRETLDVTSQWPKQCLLDTARSKKKPMHHTAACKSCLPAHHATGGEPCRVQLYSAVPGQELWKPGRETSQAQTLLPSGVSVLFPRPLQRWRDLEPRGCARGWREEATRELSLSAELPWEGVNNVLLLWWLSICTGSSALIRLVLGPSSN